MTDDPLKTASQCRHYAMCKIDYLETGLCPSGPTRHYVAYYPQGRMDIYAALKRGIIPLTPALIDIASTCTLCGICDKQCHFVTGMRPSTVMKALKAEVDTLQQQNTPVQPPPPDGILDQLRQIVGPANATNDPAVLVSYADDPFPLKDLQMPRIVVLPSSTSEVSAIAALAHTHDIPIAIRGSGASVYGMVFTPGIVIDTARMKDITIDPANYSATVSAGVTAFELQRAASSHNLRANTAEPAATVCGNIICTGLFSTWGASYGTFADNFIDMEIVDHQGRIFHLSDPSSPNLYAYKHSPQSPPGICTRAVVPLYPTTSDEESILVPFPNFDDAILFARRLNLRRIGLSIAVLGPHYIATFLAPTLDLATRLKENLPDVFGIQYAVLVITDAYGRDAINKMAASVIDGSLIKTIMLGLPRFLGSDWLDLARSYEGDVPPYEILTYPEAAPLIESALQPSPETASQTIDPDLRPFYTSLYAKPQYTDPVWLSQNRIVSCRMGRHKHIFAFLVYLPADDIAMFNTLNETFARHASDLSIDHDFGFVTPMDMGKRAVYEYDYYLDQASPEDKQKAGAVMQRIVPWLDDLALNHKGLTWIKTFFSQGLVRKEGFFYEGFTQRKPE